MENQDIERSLMRIFRLGKVVGLNAETCKARVEFPDNQNIVTYEMPIIQPHTKNDKFYSMPALDEYVLCAFLPNAREAGFILGSYYSDATLPSIKNANKFNITFEDGTALEYDKANHKLVAHIKGEADIKTEKNITVTSAADITVKADGNINLICSEAEVKADKVTLKSQDITLGDGNGTGIITQECFCALTGGPHPDKSNTVKGVK